MRHSRPRLFHAIAPLLLAALVPAQEPAQDPADPPKRPRIGLVLSGGGARGAAHVGALQVLEELRIPIHAIAANSMGSVVGGGYSYGYSPKEMANILTKQMDWALELSDKPRRDDLDFRRKEDDRNFLIDWAVGFSDWTLKLPKGLVQGHYVENTFKLLFPQAFKLRDFDDLAIPFRAVACEIGTGEEIILKSGNLALAIKASMSIPGFFAPTEIDGMVLVDGMVVNNIPIDVGKSMGVDVIIAIDIGTPIKKPDEIETLLDITGQMVGILMQKSVDEQIDLLTDEDVLIRPELGDISSTDFDRCGEAILIGEQATRAAADRLRQFSVSEEEYAQFLRKQRRPPTVYPIIDVIEIVNDSNLADEVIAAYMDTRPGVPLDPGMLKHDLDRIHGREDFERVTFALSRNESDQIVLTIFAVAKAWGPNYIRFGLNIDDNFEGDGAYNFRVNYTMRAMNALGAELRNDFQIGRNIGVRSEFYQPVDYGGVFFVAPSGDVLDFPADLYQRSNKIAEVDVLVAGLAFDIGANISNVAQVRAGLFRDWGDVDFDINTTALTNFEFDDGGFRVSLDLDTLDDPNFPAEGSFIFAEYIWGVSGMGSDNEYQRVQARGGHAFSHEDNTLLLVTDYAGAVGSTLPIYRAVSEGGFLNLSGLQRAQLRGQYSLVFKGIVYRKISGERFETFGMPVYLGGSIEYGGVVDDRSDLFDDMIIAGSAFVGVDSPLGPVYFGYGMAEGGDDSLYLFIGQTFSGSVSGR